MNSAELSPVSTVAVLMAGNDVNAANNPNATTRSEQPAMIIARQPIRSAATPPIGNMPCWLSRRKPSTNPTSAAP